MTIITKKRLIAAGVLSALIAGNMAMAADDTTYSKAC